MPPIVIAAAIVGGTTIYASRQQEKAQEAAISSAEQQAAAQREAATEAVEAAAMTPQEQAFQSMMMERATAGLEDPRGIDITEAYMPRALEALQKHFMQRGFQPSPAQTGLLIEPSQQVAKDIALQNALLQLQAEETAWTRARGVYPEAQRLAEQRAPVTQPFATQQAYAGAQYQQATAAQSALGSMLMAYTSPLLAQRITSPTGGTSIIPQAPGGIGPTYRV